MSFRVDAPYQPTGDQPRAIAQLIEGIEKGYKHQTLLGATATGKTAVMSWVFERLKGDGFSGPTGPKVIDHLLARGANVLERPRQLPPERRDVTVGAARRVRLSDHAPVVASFEVG